MNLTVQPEKNRKRGVCQYLRAALPLPLAVSDFHRCSTSKELVSTKISTRKEHARQPALKEIASRNTRKPGFLRLDSQGESSKYEWAYECSVADDISSENDRTLALFSSIFRRCVGIRESQFTTCGKAAPVKPRDYGLTITAAVRPFGRQSNFLLPSHRSKSSVVCLGELVSTMQALLNGPHVLPSCTRSDKIVQQCHQKPVEFVSSLQPLQHRNSCRQELLDDMNIAPCIVSNLFVGPQPHIVDLSSCELTCKQFHKEKCVDLPSVLTYRSSNAVSDGFAVKIRTLHRQSRWPRFNCRRKWLHVCHSSRHRKSPMYSCSTVSNNIDKNASNSEFLDSDNDDGECDIREYKCISSDAVPPLLSSFHDLVTPCVEDSAVWINNYCSHVSLPSSLCTLQEINIQESCSFASSVFVSAKEISSSDFCCTDSDGSDCSELAPSSVYSTGDDFPEYLLPGLPCFHVPFTDNWLLGFCDSTLAGLDANFEVCFEADSTFVPDDEAVCNYSLGVEEANNRWNEAYSFPADVLSISPQHHSRMV